MRAHLVAVPFAVFLIVASVSSAEKTDEVVLWNGDTVTGEVKSMLQGQMRFKTDHAGTIFIEWEFINSVSSSDFFEIEDRRGEFFYGMLSPGSQARELAVIGPTRSVVLDMEDVVAIMPIKQTFWGRIDGSLNLGSSFTSADNIFQYSFESDATYRVRKFSAKVALSMIETRQEERETTYRDNLDFTYTRYRKNRYFGSGRLSFSRSSELGIDFRTEIGGMYGRSFVQSNRANVSGALGLTVSRETPTGEEPSEYSLSAVVWGRYHFFLYNFPKTDVSVDLGILPSISEWPRLRVDFNGALKREIITDFTVNFSIFDSYDSVPPGGAESKNHDFGVILSVGWTF
jgi:hypothetical protein